MRAQPIVTATVMAAAFGAAAFAGTYKDPQQRFEISIPAGWTAEPFGEGVKVSRGTSYCLVMEGQAPNPEALVKHLVGQLGSQWTRFQQLKQGRAAVGGQAAPYSFHSGVNAKGVPSFLKVLAVSSQGTLFSLIESAPEKEFPASKAGLEQIEQGFRFKTGPAPKRNASGRDDRQTADGQQGDSQTLPPIGPAYRPGHPAVHMPRIGGPFVGITVDDQQQARGAVISAVAPGGPAEKAGIRAGDLIVSINGRTVNDSSGMPAGLAGVHPGDALELGIVRGGRQLLVQVRMGVFHGR